jgi:hypothetical protein
MALLPSGPGVRPADLCLLELLNTGAKSSDLILENNEPHLPSNPGAPVSAEPADQLISQERIQVRAQNTHATLADPDSPELAAVNHVPHGLSVQAPGLGDLSDDQDAASAIRSLTKMGHSRRRWRRLTRFCSAQGRRPKRQPRTDGRIGDRAEVLFPGQVVDLRVTFGFGSDPAVVIRSRSWARDPRRKRATCAAVRSGFGGGVHGKAGAADSPIA